MREIKFRGWFEDIGMREVNDIQTNCVLMQYTGLKDKNGKEIYEGDICKFFHHPNDVVVISYDEQLLSNKATVVSEGIYCEDYFFIQSDSNKYEVIGNIYENPESLK